MEAKILLEKSKQNYEAFKYLRGVYLFSPSIHCAYYSCIQKIKYILLEYYTEDYNLGYESYRSKSISLHNFYLDTFFNIFVNHHDRKDGRRVDKLLKILKKMRTEADYEPVNIDDKVCQKTEEIIDEVHKLIKKSMKL